MKKKVVFLPYDMDTALGINNEGALVFSYNLEDIDQIEGGADVYNGQQSVLWKNMRDAFFDDMKEMYQGLRSSGAISYDKVKQMFEEHQAKWPEAIFNDDAWFKYIDPLIEKGNASYLSMLQGSKEGQRNWWMYYRFRYLDSKYNAGDSLKDFIIELSNNLDDIYKRDLFSYFITSNITFIKNDKEADVIKLNNNKIGVKVLNLDNNVLSKEFINKKLDTNLFINILNSFIRITNTFNETVKNTIIIFDRSMNHTIYNYFYYTELYNKNNFTVTDINEYINKLKEINIDILANMDFKLGLIYQIDDKVNRSYVNANHRLDVLVSKSKITIKYVFNVKESYIYDEVNNLISYISNIEEAKVISNIDETFLKLDKNIILEAYNLFKTDMPKYNFDFVDESKINYNAHINELINNMLSCNWIDMSYGMDIEKIESKNND